MQIFSLMCESVNLIWNIGAKRPVYNVGYVLAYFCGGHKNNFPSWFCGSCKNHCMLHEFLIVKYID